MRTHTSTHRATRHPIPPSANEFNIISDPPLRDNTVVHTHTHNFRNWLTTHSFPVPPLLSSLFKFPYFKIFFLILFFSLGATRDPAYRFRLSNLFFSLPPTSSGGKFDIYRNILFFLIFWMEGGGRVQRQNHFQIKRSLPA